MEALSRTLDRVLKNSPQPLMDGGTFDFLAAERRRAELFNQTEDMIARSVRIGVASWP